MFMHPDTQLAIARDDHRHRLQVAAEERLAASLMRSRPRKHRRFRWTTPSADPPATPVRVRQAQAPDEVERQRAEADSAADEMALVRS